MVAWARLTAERSGGNLTPGLAHPSRRKGMDFPRTEVECVFVFVCGGGEDR